MFTRDLSLAIGQLGDPRMRRVLVIGILLSLLLFAAFYAGLWALIGWLAPDSLTLPWLGSIGWLDTFLRWFAGILTFLLAMFLMAPVASTIISLFLEGVADAVEARHYPHLPPTAGVPFMIGLREGGRFLVLMVAINIALLVVFFAFAPAYPFAFYLGNGWLLGREYFNIAALRRMPPDEAMALYRRHRGQIWLGGTLLALPLSVPVINLVVPVLGAAAFTHTYHRLTGQRPAP